MVRSSLNLQCLQMYSKRYEDLGDDENLAELPPRRSTTALNRPVQLRRGRPLFLAT